MEIITHQMIDQELCGKPLAVNHGHSRIELLTTARMTADATGLVHGGFIFGLADYAAMLAVNHPNVVLGGADVKFLKPVQVDATVVAQATVQETKGKKQVVAVEVLKGDEKVFEGSFVCFALDQHVLEGSK
jgi:uncharacterized protein (TIGR00369 family)